MIKHLDNSWISRIVMTDQIIINPGQINGNQEIKYIVTRSSIPPETICQVLDIYYEFSWINGNPEYHYEIIMRKADVTLEQVKEIFDIQFKYLEQLSALRHK